MNTTISVEHYGANTFRVVVNGIVVDDFVLGERLDYAAQVAEADRLRVVKAGQSTLLRIMVEFHDLLSDAEKNVGKDFKAFASRRLSSFLAGMRDGILGDPPPKTDELLRGNDEFHHGIYESTSYMNGHAHGTFVRKYPGFVETFTAKMKHADQKLEEAKKKRRRRGSGQLERAR